MSFMMLALPSVGQGVSLMPPQCRVPSSATSGAALSPPRTRAAVPRGTTQGSHDDRDLAPHLTLLEPPHRVRRLLERVGAGQARGDLAGLDQGGELLVVGGTFLRHEQRQALAHERRE